MEQDHKSGARQTPKTLSVLIYAGMLAVAVGLFLMIQRRGSTLVAPRPSSPIATSVPAATGTPLASVLVALAVVLIVGKALGWCVARLGQPPVIGEVLGGIALGPSVLGAIAPR